MSQRIKEVRKARGMSLQELSEVCGLSVSYLSQTERGISTPSVESLVRIVNALGARIGWFFPSKTNPKHAPEEEDYVVRKNSRWEIRFTDNIRDEVLSPNLGRQIQMVLSRFAPGAYSGDPYSHEGEKCGIILSGALELWVGKRKFKLEEGDSFAFSSTEPHRYGNPGDRETMVVWVLTPPRI